MYINSYYYYNLQSVTLQKSLQVIEINSKQQQELSNRTVKELKEHLDRVILESTQREQLVNTVRKEKDRLIRENQMKVREIGRPVLCKYLRLLFSFQNAVISSMEADLASSEALQTVSLGDSTRIQTLQRSISVHEVAVASLKGEFERQKKELVEAEEEVLRLRKSLSKKVKSQHQMAT